jgi:hypothetical protein
VAWAAWTTEIANGHVGRQSAALATSPAPLSSSVTLEPLIRPQYAGSRWRDLETTISFLNVVLDDSRNCDVSKIEQRGDALPF